MKKFFTTLLCVIFVLIFAFSGIACNGGNGDGEDETLSDYEVDTVREMKTDGPRITTGDVVFPASLWSTPNVIRAPEFDAGSAKGYFIDGLEGEKFFAYVGVPEYDNLGDAVSEINKVPAVVLVHGATGTAFYEWVDFWTMRGYAAIAMSTDGNIPIMSGANVSNIYNDSHQHVATYTVGGQTFNLGQDNSGEFSDYQNEVSTQWAYHAMATVIASNSFIRSLPEVDTDRVAITGISYGAFLTCQVTAHDDRFICAVPVYASYKIRYGDVMFSKVFQDVPAKATLWDNDGVIEGNDTPFLFVNSNKDACFSVLGTTESDKAVKNSKMLLVDGLLHGHYIGAFDIPEVYYYIDGICNHKKRSPSFVVQPTAESATAKVSCPSGTALTGGSAQVLCYYAECATLTENTVWKSIPCTVDDDGETISASVPSTATHYYFQARSSAYREVTSQVVKFV